jgi:homeobox protein cut-like
MLGSDGQYVEFAASDLDHDDDVELPDPNADKANKHLGRTLENLLVVKNRRLQEEVTKLRVAHEELSSSCLKAEAELGEVQSELGKQKSLNERLENDLLMVNKGDNVKERTERQGSMTPAQGLAGLDLGGKTSVSWF